MTQPVVKRMTAMKIFLRGLAISLPTVLTLVILIWIASLMNNYIIAPTNSLVSFVLAQFIDDSVPAGELQSLPEGPSLMYCQRNYRVTEEGRSQYLQKLQDAQQDDTPSVNDEEKLGLLDLADVYVVMGASGVPYTDYEAVASKVPESEMPRTRTGLYMDLVVARHFPSLFHLSIIAVLILISLIYILGRFVTARIGAWFVRKFETLFISSLPVVRNVYGSVKQVTDFLFSENQIEVRRVIAFEYPRRGIWTIAFVTGDSLLDISAVAGEPCVSVLVPTSPMPMTGYTMSIPRSDLVDLDITIEHAFQYIVSCGVLVPVHQRFSSEGLQKRMAEQIRQARSEESQKPVEIL